MRRLFALDIGQRRTGIAFCDADDGVPLALMTIEHTSDDALIAEVKARAAQRGVQELVIGLPLLPSGKEGAQCRHNRKVGALFSKEGFRLHYLDERYTTPHPQEGVDGDKAAACQILLTYIDLEP